MRSTSVANSSVRTIDGRLTFYDERLRFIDVPTSESVVVNEYDASDNGMTRAGIYNGYLYTQANGTLPPTGTRSRRVSRPG